MTVVWRVFVDLITTTTIFKPHRPHTQYSLEAYSETLKARIINPNVLTTLRGFPRTVESVVSSAANSCALYPTWFADAKILKIYSPILYTSKQSFTL